MHTVRGKTRGPLRAMHRFALPSAPLLGALLVAACGSAASTTGGGISDAATSTDAVPLADGASAPHHDGFGGPIPPSTTATYQIQSGAGAPGQPRSVTYVITASSGGAYRVVWSTDATATEFWGSVWTTGHFTTVTPGCAGNQCALGAKDVVSNAQAVSGGQRIDFDAFPSSGFNGFDLVTDAEPIYFGLLVDGIARPAAVLFPSINGQVSSASTIPFGLTTKLQRVSGGLSTRGD